MALSLSRTNSAYERLLSIAEGRMDLVERALIAATSKARGAPKYQDVEKELRLIVQKQREPLNAA